MIQNLDAQTLAFVSALSAFVLAIAMGGIHLAGTRQRAVFDWTLAGMFFGIGHLVGFVSLAPDATVNVAANLAMANGLMALGHGFLLLGVQHYLERRRWIIPVFVLVLLVVLSQWLWPPMSENVLLRISSLSVIFVFISVVCVRLLWQGAPKPMRGFQRSVAVILLMYAMFLAARMGYLFYAQGADSEGMRANVLVPVFLTSVVFYLALAVSLALMLFRRKEMHLQFLARHDALTGLLNRYSLEEFANRELSRALRSKHDFSLVTFDLDEFKMVNDAHGHAAGDHALREVASRIQTVIRESDLAFRMGGEEFLLMLPEADAETARLVADRLRCELSSQPVVYRDREIPVSASFGVAVFDPQTDAWESLLRRADRALYRAKDNGRDRVEMEG